MKKYRFPCGCEWPIVEENTPEGVLPLMDIDTDLAPENCPATWELLGKGLAKGVFQLESPLGRQYTKRLKPNCYEHITALGALLRPGCLGTIDEDGVSTTAHYIKRRHGQEDVKKFHPAIDGILAPTYGVLAYQEQAMAICVAVAGFSEQEADMLRKAIGKKLPEEMAKCKKMFIEGSKKAGLLTEEQAVEVFGWIEASQRYSFNRCTSEHTRILRPNGGKYSNGLTLPVGEMYKIRNDIAYAKSVGKLPIYKKWKLLGNYGKALSMCDDGRIRPNIIRDIQPAGKRVVFRLETASGKTIDVTDNHKFPTTSGEMTLSEIMTRLSSGNEVELYVRGEYEETDFAKYNYSKFTNDERYNKKGLSGKDTAGPQNRWYTNGSFTEFKKNKALLPMRCGDCSKENARLEVHHINGDRENSSLENLIRLCASCHKKREYAAGRTKRGEKGYPRLVERVVTVEPIGEQETYDVTMDAPNHNFVVESGIVTCNSHAACYGVTGYRSAYLKAHNPLAFFTAWLRNAKHKQDPQQEVFELINDARVFDISVEPPDFRSLEATFHTDRKVIKFGLADIKGIGDAQIIKIRDAVKHAEELLNKPVAEWDWYEFLTNCSENITSSVVTRLIKVGAMRWLKLPRSLMDAEYKVWESLTAKEREWVRTQGIDTFGRKLTSALKCLAKPKKEGGGAANKNRISLITSQVNILENPPSAVVDSLLEIAFVEEDLLGISISCSRIDSCDISEVNCTCKEFLAGRTGYMMLGVEIQEVRELRTKSGKNPGSKYGRLIVSDSTCALEAVAWPDTWKDYSSLLNVQGNMVIVQCERDYKDNDSSTLIIRKVFQANQAGIPV